MTLHLGFIPASSTIYIPFHTFDSNGASITLTGLAVTDIEIYKNGSVTQRSSDAGYTLLDTDGIDFDGLTGLHGISIDLADNTDAGFYAAGNFYMVAIASVTVDTRTVNFWAATFYIGPVAANATQILGTAISTPATAGILDVNVKNIDNDAASASGTVTFPNATLASITNITGGTITTLTTYTGNTPQTGDNFARLGAPAGASVSADIAAMKVDTAAILVDTGTTLDGRIPAALVGGSMSSNLVSIDGQLTTGNNATLYLKSLNIQNNSGDAIAAHSVGGNGSGINSSGNGTGHGALHTGGATGHGMKAIGGGLSGQGILAEGVAGGSGFFTQGGVSGNGTTMMGGGTGGVGLRALAGGASNGHGVYSTGNGAGEGAKFEGGVTGHGAEFIGGVTSGDGIKASATTLGDGIEALGAGGGYDINADIQGTLSGGLTAAQVNAEVVDALTVDIIADSVATDGTRPTIAQALLELTRFLMERSVTGTTMTVKKEDGSTSSMTFTLNDATTPTAITRAT